jgi:hypothetical protein
LLLRGSSRLLRESNCLLHGSSWLPRCHRRRLLPPPVKGEGPRDSAQQSVLTLARAIERHGPRE